jgi:hypothetical protein
MRELLNLETDSDLDRGSRNRGEKSVVKSCTSPKPVSVGGEGKPRHNNEVQLLRA